MANIFINLLMPAGDGPGPSEDTSKMGWEKSFIVHGEFPGASIAIEVSTDNGASWGTRYIFTAAGKKVLSIASELMRVRVSGRTSSAPFTAAISVGANDNGALFASLPLPVGVIGPGPSVDVTALGDLTTVICEGDFPGSSIAVEASEDGGVNYFACGSTFFSQGGLRNKEVIATHMRTLVKGHPIPAGVLVSVGAANEAGSGPADELVKVSANDTTSGFLSSKLISGSGIELSTLNAGADEDVEIRVSGADANDLVTGGPVRVRGPLNSPGLGVALAKAGHIHRLEMEAAEEGALVGARPRFNFLGTGVTAADNPGGDSIDITIPGNVTDELVRVSADDDLAGFLEDKLVAGSGVALTVLGPGADEDIEIKVSGADANDLVTGGPVTVRGPTNAPGVGVALAKAGHVHRLEMEAADEGALQGGRPRFNFVGVGVTAVDNPGNDRIDITIPGDGDGGTVIKRSIYKGDHLETSSAVYVNAMSGSWVTVPVAGDYWAIFEGEGANQSASGIIDIGISVNSVVAVVAGTDRTSQGPAANLRPCVTTAQLPGLLAGDLVRALFRKLSGAGTVELNRRHLSIFKVQ